MPANPKANYSDLYPKTHGLPFDKTRPNPNAKLLYTGAANTPVSAYTLVTNERGSVELWFTPAKTDSPMGTDRTPDIIRGDGTTQDGKPRGWNGASPHGFPSDAAMTRHFKRQADSTAKRIADINARNAEHFKTP